MVKAIPQAGKTLLSPADHTLIMIDFQSQMAFATRSIDPVALRNNAALVANAAKIFNVSTIPTTVAEKTFSGPMFDEIKAAFPAAKYFARTTMNTWEDKAVIAEVKKGHIEVGQLADLIVPDRDYLSCAEDEIADTTSDLTIVGGKVVYGAGDFAALDETPPPPAMPNWSPVRTFGGFAAWGDPNGAGKPAFDRKLAMTCGCANACNIHGHDHATAWSGKLPIADLKSFWGVLGCACWAV
jgi:hypothetical protein